MNVDLRYYLGLSNINREEGFDDSNVQNRVFSLSVGYALN